MTEEDKLNYAKAVIEQLYNGFGRVLALLLKDQRDLAISAIRSLRRSCETFFQRLNE